MTDYTTVMATKYPDKEWSINANDYEQLTMLDGTTKPSKATLDGLWASVQTEIANEKTAREVARNELLAKLGITEAEAKLLLG